MANTKITNQVNKIIIGLSDQDHAILMFRNTQKMMRLYPQNTKDIVDRESYLNLFKRLCIIKKLIN